MRSKIEYGSIVYNSACKSILDNIIIIQQKAIKLAPSALCTSSIVSLQIITSEKLIQLRKMELTLKYVINIASKPHQPIFSNILKIVVNKNTINNQTLFYNKIQNYFNEFEIELPTQFYIPNLIPPWLIYQPMYDI